MDIKAKLIIERVATWVMDNIDLDEGIPLMFGLGSPEQDYLEQLLKEGE